MNTKQGQKKIEKIEELPRQETDIEGVSVLSQVMSIYVLWDKLNEVIDQVNALSQKEEK